MVVAYTVFHYTLRSVFLWLEGCNHQLCRSQHTTCMFEGPMVSATRSKVCLTIEATSSKALRACQAA